MNRTILYYLRNVHVNKTNEKVINLLNKTVERIYMIVKALLKVFDNNESIKINYDEIFQYLNPIHLLSHELHLIKCLIIILIRNLNINRKLYGKQFLILDISNN